MAYSRHLILAQPLHPHIWPLPLSTLNLNYVILMLTCATLLERNPVPEICQVNSAFFQGELCLFPAIAPSKMSLIVTFPGMILQS